MNLKTILDKSIMIMTEIIKCEPMTLHRHMVMNLTLTTQPIKLLAASKNRSKTTKNKTETKANLKTTIQIQSHNKMNQQLTSLLKGTTRLNMQKLTLKMMKIIMILIIIRQQTKRKETIKVQSRTKCRIAKVRVTVQ